MGVELGTYQQKINTGFLEKRHINYHCMHEIVSLLYIKKPKAERLVKPPGRMFLGFLL